MTSIVLIPWAKTEWSRAGRLSGRTPLPLTDTGRREADEWANALAGRELAAVYCGDDPTSRKTGGVLAERAEVRLKHLPDLSEVDVGLWEGLTAAEVESRNPKLFKRWIEKPFSVCPPEGEAVGPACSRILDCVQRIARKHKGASIAVVLGPISMAAIRAALEHGEAGRMHEMKTKRPVWYRVGEGQALAVGASL
jgi:broad specificity phosphatase PhoE